MNDIFLNRLPRQSIFLCFHFGLTSQPLLFRDRWYYRPLIFENLILLLSINLEFSPYILTFIGYSRFG